MVRRIWMIRVARGMYLIGLMLLLVTLLLSLMHAAVSADTGAIWTTNESCANPAAQDDNHYAIGETVHIRGENFDPGTYYYRITGRNHSGDPGAVVADGSASVDDSGYFCTAAYQVQTDDWGGYSVDVYDNSDYQGSSKNDNYNVDGSPQLSVSVAALSVNCEAALFSVTISNIGSDIAANVSVSLVAGGDAVNGTASPAVQNLGDLDPGAQSVFQVSVPVNWSGQAADAFITLDAAASGDNASLVSSSANAVNPGNCQPGLSLNLSGGGQSCYPSFTITVANNGYGTVNAITVQFSYSSGLEYVNPNTALEWTFDMPSSAGPWQMSVPLPVTEAWLTATEGALIGVQAQISASTPPVTVSPASGLASNPGNCSPLEEVINLTLTPVCVVSQGDLTGQHRFIVNNPNDFDVSYTWSLGELGESGVGSAPPGSSELYVTAVQPGLTTLSWYDENSELQSTQSNQNSEYCEPQFTWGFEKEDTPSCSVYPDTECVFFLVNLENLPEGAEVVLNTSLEGPDLPTAINVGEAYLFSQDGEHEVEVCAGWPGIGFGNDPLAVVVQGALSIDGEVADSLTAMIYYDPATMREVCQPPEEQMVILDPYCTELPSGDWGMTWAVQNPTDFEIIYIWQFEGGTPLGSSANGNSIQVLDTVPLGDYTVFLFWGDDGFQELTAGLSLSDCEVVPVPTPTTAPAGPAPVVPVVLPAAPPVVVQPIPVTAPEPVSESGEVLVPVTGADTAALGLLLGSFRQAVLFAALVFIGMAMVFHGLGRWPY